MHLPFLEHLVFFHVFFIRSFRIINDELIISVGRLNLLAIAYPTSIMSSHPPLTLSFHDLKQHSNDRDCWIAVHSKIYDITDYLDSHPGGSSSLFKNPDWSRKAAYV